MTALPNQTCYSVVDHYCVEVDKGVFDVHLVKMELPDADKYSRYAVLFNFNYNKLETQLADMSGSWKKIAHAKSDAERRFKLIDKNAKRLVEVKSSLDTLKSDSLLKAIREYNNLLEFFSNYYQCFGFKLKFDISKQKIVFLNRTKRTTMSDSF